MVEVVLAVNVDVGVGVEIDAASGCTIWVVIDDTISAGEAVDLEHTFIRFVFLYLYL